MDEYLGMIKIFAGSFAPRGWAMCQGQLLQIQANEALYTLLGTTYGGDGKTTFGVPDYRGRVPIGAGTGPALSPVTNNQQGGAEFVTLSNANLPSHTHPLVGSVTLPVNDNPANTKMPVGGYLAQSTDAVYLDTKGTDLAGAFEMTLNTAMNGGSVPLDTMPPFLAVNYIICLSGMFPTQN